MKIDFYAPKKYYGCHVASLSGYVFLLIFVLILPFKKGYCESYGFYILFSAIAFFAFFFLLPLPFYLFEWLLKLRVKKRFLLENKFYDFFFDLGAVFYLLPVVWFLEMCKFKAWPFVALLVLFVLIRVLKSRYQTETNPEGAKKPC